MKSSKFLILSITVSTFLFAGCETKTGTGVLAGGAIGAGTGALIGGGKGALIGGAVGVITGGLVGAALDEQERKIMEQKSPATVQHMDKGEPLTIDDVINLHEGGISDETIIRYIRETKTTYNLSQEQIRKMQSSGISRRVINYMIDTGR